MAARSEIVTYLDSYLNIPNIDDASRNGLQVEGASSVRKVGLAVDGCLEVFEKAAELSCQLVFVHHGIIWGGLKSITGPVHSQIKMLIENDINLYAAHLPLDMHPKTGNNICLAKLLQLQQTEPFGVYHGTAIGFRGVLKRAASVEDLATRLQKKLGGPADILPFGPKKIKSVGIVSGGGSSCLMEAAEKGIDCVVTGEGNHSNHHLAKETGLNVIYAGHYHTEQCGVQAIGNLLKRKFGVTTTYIDVPTLI